MDDIENEFNQDGEDENDTDDDEEIRQICEKYGIEVESEAEEDDEDNGYDERGMTILEGPDIIYRDQWGALPPKKKENLKWSRRLHPMEHPVSIVAFNFNTDSEKCDNLEKCCEVVRAIQKRHLEENLTDIAYNFLIGEDCRIYEGRGWDIKPDKSLRFRNFWNTRLDIAYIGDYRTSPLPTEMFEKAMELIRFGRYMQYVKQSYELMGYSEPEPLYDPEDRSWSANNPKKSNWKKYLARKKGVKLALERPYK